MGEGTVVKLQTSSPLPLGAALTISEVSRLRKVLLQALAGNGSLALDLSAVAEVDVAGLQLLCSAHRFASREGKALVLTDAAEQLHDVARAAGFVHFTPCRFGSDCPCLWGKTSGQPFGNDV